MFAIRWYNTNYSFALLCFALYSLLIADAIECVCVRALSTYLYEEESVPESLVLSFFVPKNDNHPINVEKSLALNARCA